MCVCVCVCVCVCLCVCLSDRLRKTQQRKELSTCGFLQMFRNLSNSVQIYKWNLGDVKKDVKNDAIVTSSGHYGAKNALFDHKNRYKITKSAQNCPKIGLKLGLIKFFKNCYGNSDLHDSTELPSAMNHEILAKKWCIKMEPLRENRKS